MPDNNANQKKVREKAKFTIIDAVIILVVLAVIAFGALKILPSMLNTSNEKVEFVVQLAAKEPALADAMHVGDRVTLSLTEKDGGVIKDLKTEPSVQMVFNSIDGVYKNEIVDGKVDIYVTVEADAEVSDIAVKMGGTKVQVGAEIPVRGKGYASMGYIIESNAE